jgi:hypothetical protein
MRRGDRVTTPIRARELAPGMTLLLEGIGCFTVVQCCFAPGTSDRVVWIELDNGMTGDLRANEVVQAVQ